MVSGFLTSPCDQSLMSSAVARPMRRSSKKLTSSTWLSPNSPSVTRGSDRLARTCDSDLFDTARLAPGQVDAEFFSGPEDVLVCVAHLDGGAVAGQHLHVQAQRLHLLDQYLERLRNARLGYVLALDDCLVDLHPAEDVVGLDGQQLLQCVSGAVRF